MIKAHKELRKILVPVPLSSDMNIPLQQALHFSRVYGSGIILLNIIPEYSIFHKLLKPKKQIWRKRAAKQKLKKLVKNFFNGELPDNVTLRVVKGTLVTEILKSAAELECDLIIIKKAKRLKSRFSYLKTENADRLIADAICPVLTIFSAPTADKINKIMIPVDIFKVNTNKVAWSISLAKKFNAKLHLVSVLNTNISLKDSLAYKKSKEIEDQIRDEGIEVSKVILRNSEKSPEQAVLDHAAEIKPDILLIMTHKESALRDNYLGSFAQELIHNCTLPVFSVVPRRELLLEGIIKPVPNRLLNEIKPQVKSYIKL
ncbi:MAG: universal stress protein [Bacteroidales bacterium]